MLHKNKSECLKLTAFKQHTYRFSTHTSIDNLFELTHCLIDNSLGSSSTLIVWRWIFVGTEYFYSRESLYTILSSNISMGVSINSRNVYNTLKKEVENVEATYKRYAYTFACTLNWLSNRPTLYIMLPNLYHLHLAWSLPRICCWCNKDQYCNEYWAATLTRHFSGIL